MPAGGDIEVRVAIGLMLRKGLQDSVVRKMVEASRRDVVTTSHTACSEPLCPVLFCKGVSKVRSFSSETSHASCPLTKKALPVRSTFCSG